MVLYALQHTPSYLVIKHSKDTKQSELPHSKWHLARTSEHPEQIAKSAPQTALAMTTSSTNQILAASTTSTNQLLATQTNKHLVVSTSSPNKQTIQHVKDKKESRNVYKVRWWGVTVSISLQIQIETVVKKKKLRWRRREREQSRTRVLIF